MPSYPKLFCVLLSWACCVPANAPLRSRNGMPLTSKVTRRCMPSEKMKCCSLTKHALFTSIRTRPRSERDNGRPAGTLLEDIPFGSIMTDYKEARPDSPYFFCHMDGYPMTHNHFQEIISVMKLHTNWHFLHLMPHCYRVGGATHAYLSGHNIQNIQYSGCWDVLKSMGMKVYIHPGLYNMTPQQIHAELPRYHCQWHFETMRRLLNWVSRDYDMREVHPHFQLLQRDEFKLEDKRQGTSWYHTTSPMWQELPYMTTVMSRGRRVTGHGISVAFNRT